MQPPISGFLAVDHPAGPLVGCGLFDVPGALNMEVSRGMATDRILKETAVVDPCYFSYSLVCDRYGSSGVDWRARCLWMKKGIGVVNAVAPTFFTVSFAFSLAASLILNVFVPRPSWLPVRPPMPLPLQFSPNFSDPYLSTLRNATRFAFSSYFSRCSSSDEIDPLSGSCRATYGFHATLLESLELLRLLELDDLLATATTFLQKTFSCASLGWVRRSELWVRAVGSLLGAFLLTGEGFFLEAAECCAGRLIVLERRTRFPSALVSPRDFLISGGMWWNGTSLSEIGAGLPELRALYEVTGNVTYHQHFLRTVGNLRRFGLPLPSLFSWPRGFRGTNLSDIDYLTSGFYGSLAISQCIRPDRRLTNIFTKSSILFNYSSSANASRFFPLIDVVGRSHKSLLQDARTHYADGLAFDAGGDAANGGFRFDGSVIRHLVRAAALGNDSDAAEIVRKSMIESLYRCRQKYGFSGIKHTNSGAMKFEPIQPAAILGDWIKAGALVAPVYRGLVAGSVFNARGHIILCDELLNRWVWP
jgi:hypothetical protein